MENLSKLLGKDYSKMMDKEQDYMLRFIKEMLEEIEEPLEDNLSTWEKLMENEEFRDLSSKTRILIWELVKIKENDSPKNQTMVARQYDVSDAHLSQVKQKIDDLGL